MPLHHSTMVPKAGEYRPKQPSTAILARPPRGLPMPADRRSNGPERCRRVQECEENLVPSSESIRRRLPCSSPARRRCSQLCKPRLDTHSFSTIAMRCTKGILKCLPSQRSNRSSSGLDNQIRPKSHSPRPLRHSPPRQATRTHSLARCAFVGEGCVQGAGQTPWSNGIPNAIRLFASINCPAQFLRRPAGAIWIGRDHRCPRIALRFIRGYIPAPRWGELVEWIDYLRIARVPSPLTPLPEGEGDVVATFRRPDGASGLGRMIEFTGLRDCPHPQPLSQRERGVMVATFRRPEWGGWAGRTLSCGDESEGARDGADWVRESTGARRDGKVAARRQDRMAMR